MDAYTSCSKCKAVYPDGVTRSHAYCRACLNAYGKKWRGTNPEKEKAQIARKNARLREREGRLCTRCGDPVPAGAPSYVCRACETARMREWRKNHPEHRPKARAYQRQYLRDARKRVLDHYGGKCACCGEATYEFLALDHINGGGGRARREMPEGKNLWRWARQNGLPDTLRVLCHNCNMALGVWGYCPHNRLPTEAPCER